MSTQNVNEKPSTKESTTLRTDGFVRNIHSRNPFDVIRADVVLERIEKKAGRSCGMHYELYQAHLLGGALDYLDALPLKGVVSENGIYGHSRFCNTDFDDKLACLNLSG
ncbi:hypothetical protein, partial [Klebsiella pneumoniae]